MLTFNARVNRAHSPQQALDALGSECKQYVDRRAVNAMPNAPADEIEIVFFKVYLRHEQDGFISNDDLERKFISNGLKPVDPISLAALNERKVGIAYDKGHLTQWKDAEGKWYVMRFGSRGNGMYKEDYRIIVVQPCDRGGIDFGCSCGWVAGVRK